jgi:hypothetical protein
LQVAQVVSELWQLHQKSSEGFDFDREREHQYQFLIGIHLEPQRLECAECEDSFFQKQVALEWNEKKCRHRSTLGWQASPPQEQF